MEIMIPLVDIRPPGNGVSRPGAHVPQEVHPVIDVFVDVREVRQLLPLYVPESLRHVIVVPSGSSMSVNEGHRLHNSLCQASE